MIVVYSPTAKTRMAIDGVIRSKSSQWFLIGIGMGFETCCLLVNAESEDDAMNKYANSKYGHLTEVKPGDMRNHLNPERKKAIELMHQIEDSATDALYQLEYEHDYNPMDFDSVHKDIRDWADECDSFDWDSHYNDIKWLGNTNKKPYKKGKCFKPYAHQLDNIRIFECIPKNQIKWFYYKNNDLMFDPNRNQQF